MSKHGNNNAKHVLAIEGRNAIYAGDIMQSQADELPKNEVVNILDEQGTKNILYAISVLKRVIAEVETVLPKEENDETHASRNQ